jgi:hypothetical protein
MDFFLVGKAQFIGECLNGVVGDHCIFASIAFRHSLAVSGFLSLAFGRIICAALAIIPGDCNCPFLSR